MATPIYDKSIFAKYFNPDDAEAVTWADNVLAKLVDKGIIANYIVREDDNGVTDFEVLYGPIALFFGYLVRLAREFMNFKENPFLGEQYLANKGVFMCGDETLNEILYLISNLLRVRAHRGTLKMIEESVDPNIPHGELLRLICWDIGKFFKLGVAQSKMNSWCLNNSSPLYRGCTGRYDLNIGYEYTESVDDLSVYPLINSQYISLSTYFGKECMEIEGVPSATISGIGANVAGKRIAVTPDLNFEITFSVAQDRTDENITFGCLAFDASGNIVSLQNIVTGFNSNFFFETRRLNKPGKFYEVRGILYNTDQSLLNAADAKLNIGFGHNLRMPATVTSIIPYIIVDYVTSDDVDTGSSSVGVVTQNAGGYDGTPSVYLWNLKVTPCSLVYERSYLNNKNFIDIILTNKNARYTNADVHEILRKFFIPYNTAFNTSFFDSIAAVEAGAFLLLESGDFLLLESGDNILLEQQ
jgi:hypothetical protein